MSPRIHVYSCARQSDVERLEADLASSPEIKDGLIGLTVLWDKPSAAGAYSQAIQTATAEILVFAHCDVYFPQGWFERLGWEVDRLSSMDPDWSVAGISSLTPPVSWSAGFLIVRLSPSFRKRLAFSEKRLQRLFRS